MRQLISLALLVGGVVLFLYGLSESHSLFSDFSRLFTGSPTDKAIWLVVGGIVAAVVGAAGLLREKQSL